MITKSSSKVVGDYGNPSGTGLAEMRFTDLPYGANDVATAQTALATFHAAMIAAALVATAQGDIGITLVSENFPDKPGADVNVDRRLEYSWRTKSDSSIKRGTLHGVPATSSGIDKLPQGERLNDTGKTALATALEALYAIDHATNPVIILSGKVLQKA